MPRTKGKKSESLFTAISFIQCSLTTEEKKHFTEWHKKQETALDTLVIEVLQSGHKIGFSFNDNTDSFVVSCTGKPDECINASKCYTSHGKDYGIALWVALYKFHVLWRKGVWEDVSDDDDFG